MFLLDKCIDKYIIWYLGRIVWVQSYYFTSIIGTSRIIFVLHQNQPPCSSKIYCKTYRSKVFGSLQLIYPSPTSVSMNRQITSCSFRNNTQPDHIIKKDGGIWSSKRLDETGNNISLSLCLCFLTVRDMLLS